MDIRTVALCALLAGCGSGAEDDADHEGSPDAASDPASAATFEESWTVTGASAGSSIGIRLTALGDVDGDDASDWAVTDWAAHSVSVRSGATGAVLYPIEVEDGEESSFGNRLSSIADVDGDGVEDLLVSAWTANDLAGRVTIHSGADGALVRTVAGEPGMELGCPAGLDDLDGDDVPELAVGAPGATIDDVPDAGAVLIVNAATGEVERSAPGWAVGDVAASFGCDLAAAGDVDGDGHADVVAAAMWDGDGSARVVSSATAEVLHELTPSAEAVPLGFGFTVAGGGDVDGDAVPDVAVGCVQCSPGGEAESGYAAVYSGATGEQLLGAGGRAAGDAFGGAIAFVRDLDGDGRDEWIVSASASALLPVDVPGYVEVRSGADGHVLLTLSGPAAYAAFGDALAVADFSGDGKPDLLVGAPGVSRAGAEYAGAVTLFVQIDG